ncbi:MAG: NnrS family protein, partial [Povalibacter sp.]
MSSTSAMTLPPGALRILAAAPHRPLFFIGAANVLAAMLWWAMWLADARWHWSAVSQSVVPGGWLHAFLMLYQVLPSFIFGFLLTVFPRWMRQAPLTARHYVPVAGSMLAGQVLTLLGTFGGMQWLRAGALLTFVGWFVGTATLLRSVYRDAAREWHAVSCT